MIKSAHHDNLMSTFCFFNFRRKSYYMTIRAILNEKMKDSGGNRMDTDKLPKRKYIDSIILKELILALRELGGIATRKEIKKELKTTSERIPEEYIDYVKISDKGNKFRPFNFPFNFGIKALEFSNFVILDENKNVELTEKGRTFDLSSETSLNKEVHRWSDSEWDRRSKANKKKNKQSVIDPVNEEEIDDAEEDKAESWKDELKDALINMNPTKFELFSRALVKEMGVDIDKNIGIQPVADGGLDGFGYITANDFRTSRVAIQAKRWNGSVSSPEIDKFRGAMDKYNAEFGIFITTSVFTKHAIKASREGTRVITLIDGEEIANLVEKHQLYIKKVETYELDTFFTDND